MRASSPEQTAHWLPGADCRVRWGSARQSHGDQNLAGDGYIA